MPDNSEDLFNRVFEKLDDLNGKLSEFRVESARSFGALPCGRHEEAIKGVRSRFAVVTGIVVALVTALGAAAFKVAMR